MAFTIYQESVELFLKTALSGLLLFS